LIKRLRRKRRIIDATDRALIFGDPKTGTPLMNEYPSLSIDLPLKAAAWESADAKVYLSFNSADFLIERHQLKGEPFKALEALFARAVE
jgi:uncharacterized protein (DUF302 family)